jgi:hypothetical protein
MVVTSFSLLSTVMEVDLQIVDTPQQPHWILAQTEVMLFSHVEGMARSS